MKMLRTHHPGDCCSIHIQGQRCLRAGRSKLIHDNDRAQCVLLASWHYDQTIARRLPVCRVKMHGLASSLQVPHDGL